MSLPLSRRIARAALIVAAGGASVVGAAGAASAAPNVGGLNPEALTGTAATATDVASTTILPTATQTAGTVVDTATKTGVPAAQGLAGNAGTAAQGALANAPVQTLPLG